MSKYEQKKVQESFEESCVLPNCLHLCHFFPLKYKFEIEHIEISNVTFEVFIFTFGISRIAQCYFHMNHHDFIIL